MKCPKCKALDLRATRIEDDLPAAGCSQCHGALVSLLYYRDWAERHQGNPVNLSSELSKQSAINDVKETNNAITCPKCSRLMTKYKISGCVANRLDVCPGCDEAWLDGGEWELLKALELSHQMPMVFTEQWQRTIRRQAAEETRRSILKKSIGEPSLTQVDEFKKWLHDHPNKASILVYLYAE